MSLYKNAVEISHDIIKRTVSKGDIVIDATAGNGNDTIILAELVGEKGKVYSFDIQKKAINKTKTKLLEKKILDRVELVQDGHEYINKYVNEKDIVAIMFNLGYLPGGDHSIHTKPKTTIKALKEGMNIIKKNGIIIIAVYYGGDSGFDEKEKVLTYLRSIEPTKYTVLEYNFINQKNCPPIAVCIQRIK